MQRFREPVSGFTHLAGAIAAALGLIVLVVLTREDTAKMISMGVYGLSATALFLASTVMHLSHGSPRKLDWLRTLDHAAIYLLIAGTYTPICYNVLTGTWRWGMLGLIWLLAFGGIIYKLVTRHRAHSQLSTAFYVAMGWAALLVLPRALELLPPGAILGRDLQPGGDRLRHQAAQLPPPVRPPRGLAPVRAGRIRPALRGDPVLRGLNQSAIS